MKRLIRASVEELQELFRTAENGAADIEQADYPPGCTPARGPLRFRPLQVGGIKVEVERGELEADDFRLSALFYSGACVFANAEDFARFLRGPVATAFGAPAPPIETAPVEPTPDEPVRLEPAPPVEPAADPVPSLVEKRQRAKRSPALPSPETLAKRLSRTVRGQEAAVSRIAGVVAAHRAKRHPARPESVLLIGPTGTGKTTAVEALPAALASRGRSDVHVFRVDCAELTDYYAVRRFLGCAPGLVGYTDEPPFFAALRKPGCIVLLDEFEKADPSARRAFLGLLDEGRLTAPDGASVSAPGAIVALTTNAGADDLLYALRDVPDHEPFRQQVCRDHLLREGWEPELVGRLGAFAVFEPVSADTLHEIAADAIRALGREYGFDVETIEPVLVDVVLDLADAEDIGARALVYAARDLLAEAFARAARNDLAGTVSLAAGPPPEVTAAPEVAARAG